MAKKSPFELYKDAFILETGMNPKENYDQYIQYIKMRSLYDQAQYLKSIENILDAIHAEINVLTMKV